MPRARSEASGWVPALYLSGAHVLQYLTQALSPLPLSPSHLCARRVGAPTSSAMAYLGEFHTEQSRARSMVILGLFPGGSTLLVAGLAYLVLPLHLPWAAFR